MTNESKNQCCVFCENGTGLPCNERTCSCYQPRHSQDSVCEHEYSGQNPNFTRKCILCDKRIEPTPNKSLDILIRDLTQVGSIPKSEARRRIEELIKSERERIYKELNVQTDDIAVSKSN